jgi:hypothetical protein
MNNYIVLDGKQYKTPSRAWNAVETKPATVRNTLLGEIDVTFGSTTIQEWQGMIEGPTVATPPWGTIADLRATLRKTTTVVYTDHYGLVTYDVVCVGPFKEESFSPKWDGDSNYININARIVKVKVHA